VAGLISTEFCPQERPPKKAIFALLLGRDEKARAKALRRKGSLQEDDLEPVAEVAAADSSSSLHLCALA
jgi:hypothetical protein